MFSMFRTSQNLQFPGTLEILCRHLFSSTFQHNPENTTRFDQSVYIRILGNKAGKEIGMESVAVDEEVRKEES